ncbi:prepilin peptidase [Arcobacter sp. FWKO B]|nr:prepilin peptidase [Arcobacter sp. FWKO B]
MVEFSIVVLGAIFGSFLNVLIYRLPRNNSIIYPNSTCPKCNTPIKWYNNIPIFSYVFLQGKCATCKERIPLRYIIVEVFTPILTLLCYLKFGLNIDFLIGCLLMYNLIVLSFIDFEYKAVPDYLLLAILLISPFLTSDIIEFIKNAFIFAGGFVILNFFVTFYIQNIKSYLLKDDSLKNQIALGEGDIPVIAIIGGLLGIKLGLLAIFVSAVIALIHSIYNHYKKEPQTAFIPYLSLGFIIIYMSESILN